MLYSRSLLVIYFIYSCVYVSIPISQFIPLPVPSQCSLSMYEHPGMPLGCWVFLKQHPALTLICSLLATSCWSLYQFARVDVTNIVEPQFPEEIGSRIQNLIVNLVYMPFCVQGSTNLDRFIPYLLFKQIHV